MMIIDENNGLRKMLDTLVAGYLGRQHYSNTMRSLMSESPSLKASIQDMGMPIMLNDTVHGKHLEEILILFNQHGHFNVSPHFLEFGHKLRSLANEYVALTNADAHWSDAQRTLYGRHVPPSIQARRAITNTAICAGDPVAINVYAGLDSLKVVESVENGTHESIPSSSEHSGTRRKCNQPMRTNERLKKELWKEVVEPAVHSAQQFFDNTITTEPASSSQSVSLISIDENAIGSLDRCIERENFSELIASIERDLPENFFDDGGLSSQFPIDSINQESFYAPFMEPENLLQDAERTESDGSIERNNGQRSGCDNGYPALTCPSTCSSIPPVTPCLGPLTSSSLTTSAPISAMTPLSMEPSQNEFFHSPSTHDVESDKQLQKKWNSDSNVGSIDNFGFFAPSAQAEHQSKKYKERKRRSVSSRSSRNRQKCTAFEERVEVISHNIYRLEQSLGQPTSNERLEEQQACSAVAVAEPRHESDDEPISTISSAYCTSDASNNVSSETDSVLATEEITRKIKGSIDSGIYGTSADGDALSSENKQTEFASGENENSHKSRSHQIVSRGKWRPIAGGLERNMSWSELEPQMNESGEEGVAPYIITDSRSDNIANGEMENQNRSEEDNELRESLSSKCISSSDEYVGQEGDSFLHEHERRREYNTNVLKNAREVGTREKIHCIGNDVRVNENIIEGDRKGREGVDNRKLVDNIFIKRQMELEKAVRRRIEEGKQIDGQPMEEANMETQKMEQEQTELRRTEEPQAEKRARQEDKSKSRRIEVEKLQQRRIEENVERRKIEEERGDRRRNEELRAERRKMEEEAARIYTVEREAAKQKIEQEEIKQFRMDEQAERHRIEQETLRRMMKEEAEKRRIEQEETKRCRIEEEAEKRRIEQEEIRRRRIEAEEAEQRRVEHEDAEKRRIDKEAERRRLEEEEIRKKKEEADRRRREQEEIARHKMEEEEEAERRRIETEEKRKRDEEITERMKMEKEIIERKKKNDEIAERRRLEELEASRKQEAMVKKEAMEQAKKKREEEEKRREIEEKERKKREKDEKMRREKEEVERLAREQEEKERRRALEMEGRRKDNEERERKEKEYRERRRKEKEEKIRKREKEEHERKRRENEKKAREDMERQGMTEIETNYPEYKFSDNAVMEKTVREVGKLRAVEDKVERFKEKKYAREGDKEGHDFKKKKTEKFVIPLKRKLNDEACQSSSHPADQIESVLFGDESQIQKKERLTSSKPKDRHHSAEHRRRFSAESARKDSYETVLQNERAKSDAPTERTKSVHATRKVKKEKRQGAEQNNKKDVSKCRDRSSALNIDDLFDTIIHHPTFSGSKKDEVSISEPVRKIAEPPKRVSSGVDKGREVRLIGGGHSARVGMVLEKAMRMRLKLEHEARIRSDHRHVGQRSSQHNFSALDSRRTSCSKTQPNRDRGLACLSSGYVPEKEASSRKRILDLPLPKNLTSDPISDSVTPKDVHIDRIRRYAPTKGIRTKSGDSSPVPPLSVGSSPQALSSRLTHSPCSYSSPDISSSPSDESIITSSQAKKIRIDSLCIGNVLDRIHTT